jgi:hypothetical protein
MWRNRRRNNNYRAASRDHNHSCAFDYDAGV